jgi:hypothetical protein
LKPQASSGFSYARDPAPGWPAFRALDVKCKSGAALRSAGKAHFWFTIVRRGERDLSAHRP